MTDNPQSSEAEDQPRFVVECDDCAMACQTDDFGEAIDFAVNHHRHTEHSLTWKRSTLVDGVVSIPQRTRWKVVCDSCDTTRLFTSKDDAEEFFSEHEKYAGHSADQIEEVTLAELSELNSDMFREVLEYCFEHAESTDIVPLEAVMTAFEEAGVPTKRAADELTIVEQDMDVRHAGEGYIIKY